MKTIGPLCGLLLALSFAVAASQNTPSDNLLSFLNVLTGFYTNKRQSSSTARFVPVEVPALSPSITFFLEEAVDGVIYQLKLLKVSESDGVIRLQTHSLVDDPSQISPGTFDLDQLKNLETSDLNTDPACDVLYEAIEPMVFMGTWPYCDLRENGQKPPLSVTMMTCNSLAFYSPAGAPDSSGRLPVAGELTERYPLLPYMLGDRQDFVNPCDS